MKTKVLLTLMFLVLLTSVFGQQKNYRWSLNSSNTYRSTEPKQKIRHGDAIGSDKRKPSKKADGKQIMMLFMTDSRIGEDGKTVELILNNHKELKIWIQEVNYDGFLVKELKINKVSCEVVYNLSTKDENIKKEISYNDAKKLIKNEYLSISRSTWYITTRDEMAKKRFDIIWQFIYSL